MAGNVWADREEDRLRVPHRESGNGTVLLLFHSTISSAPYEEPDARYRLRPRARGDHHPRGASVTRLPRVDGAISGTALPLAWLSRVHDPLLRERATCRTTAIVPLRPSARTWAAAGLPLHRADIDSVPHCDRRVLGYRWNRFRHPGVKYATTIDASNGEKRPSVLALPSRNCVSLGDRSEALIYRALAQGHLCPQGRRNC